MSKSNISEGTPMPNYLEELNDSQRAAVLYNDGPSLVIAGAGSGKTRVLTYKIAHLLETGLEPWNILALTFTNKAAREMKERIGSQVGNERARYLWMGTFHSIFARILRSEAKHLNFSSNYTIYDSSDSRSLLRSIIKEMQLDDKTYKVAAVQARISQAKNQLMTPADYAASKVSYEDDLLRKMPAIREIFTKYWDRCRQADAMDFDDLLLYTFILFRDHQEVLAKYQNQFKYLLVDEYQDTNIAQHYIVLLLSKLHERIFVVGDDAQSIYSFRGANIDNILNFTTSFPKTKVFKLEQNYRSTQTIVSAANSLIKKNRRQIPKEVYSQQEVGNLIQVLEAYSDIEEAEIVASKINELQRTNQFVFDDYAVLYRTNAQSRVFEEAFRRRFIPYQIYGGLSFYQRKEIKDCIAYFRLVVNPNDEEAFKRVINYPTRGIGAVTQDKLLSAAIHHQVSLWKVLCTPELYGVDLSKRARNSLTQFQTLIGKHIDFSESQSAYEVGVNLIREAGIMADLLTDKSPESLSKKENIEELISGMNNFCNDRQEEGDEAIFLRDYLSEVSLLTDQDEANEDEPKVTLMTVHAAKGLEFKNVFVVGLEENLFPSFMGGDSPRELEEERRLFYVALTRAERNCFLTHAKSRFRYGKTEFGTPSRFLREIDIQYLDFDKAQELGRRVDHAAHNFRNKLEDLQHSRRVVPTADQSSLSAGKRFKRVGALSASSGNSKGVALTVQVGQTIEHERFGRGEVLAVEGEGDNAKAKIAFTHAGEKQLLLRFARFKVVE